MTDAGGHITTFTFNAGEITSVAHPGFSSPNISVGYSSGRVSSVTSAGITWNYAWTDDFPLTGKRTLSVTGPLAHEQIIVSQIFTGLVDSSAKRIWAGSGPLAWRTTNYFYDGPGRLIKVMPQEGNFTEYTLDTRGNIRETRHYDKAGTNPITTSASYPDCTGSNQKICNQPDSTTDGLGHVTNYTYDSAHGGVTKIEYPAVSGSRKTINQAYWGGYAWAKFNSNTVELSSDVVYLPTVTTMCLTATTCAGTANEQRTSIGYYGGPSATNMNVERVDTGSGTTTMSTVHYTYDVIGNPISTTDPLGNVSYAFYDADRRVIGTISQDPDGPYPAKRRATRSHYNAQEQVWKVEQGTVTGTTDFSTFALLAKVEQAFDGYGRPTYSSAFGTGARYSVTQKVYEGAGRVACQIQRMNPAVFNTLPVDCSLSTTGPDGPDRVTIYEYNPGDEVFAVRNAVGVSGQEQTTQYFEYTPNGQTAWVKDANGNKTSFSYDGYDRLYRTYYPDPSSPGNSSATDYEQQTLIDNNGNVTRRQLRDGTVIGYSYDALNRRATKGGSTISDVAYSYDVAGRMTGATAGRSVSFTYDALGRKLSETQHYGSVSYQYDAAGRRTRMSWSDGNYVSYDYLTTGELNVIRENGASTGPGVLAIFHYNDLGQRIQMVRGNGAITDYAYDSAWRLQCLKHDLPSSGGTVDCTPTASGNDQSTAFSYNVAGQLSSISKANDAYAWNGVYNVDRTYAVNGLNQYTGVSSSVSITPSYDGRGNLTSAGSTTYGYNGNNEMSAAWAPGGTSEFYYDSIGRLTDFYGPSSARFVYDGVNVAAEISTPGTFTRRYVWGAGPDELIVWYEGSGLLNPQWTISDERGSIISVTNGAGASIATNSYDPWGIPAATNMGRFQYTGQMWLSDVGLYNYKARFYSATLGRFLQTDPIGYADGMNWYAYVSNDPINGTDPSGMRSCSTAEWTSGNLECSITVTSSRKNFNWLFQQEQEVPADRNQRDREVEARKRIALADARKLTPKNAHQGCAAPAISSAERMAAQSGNRSGFWNSRSAAGDPLAGTALSIVNNSNFSGQFANVRLRDYISSRSPGMSSSAISAEVQQIGVDLMRAHVAAVDNFGSPTTQDIANYHRDVFNAHGLPGSIFGGTMLLGSAGLTNAVTGWAGCRF